MSQNPFTVERSRLEADHSGLADVYIELESRRLPMAPVVDDGLLVGIVTPLGLVRSSI